MSDQDFRPQKKEAFDVDKIPVETRRMIKLGFLIFVMAIIIAVWLPFAIKSISDNSAEGSGQLTGVGKDLEIFLEGIKNGAEKIQGRLTQDQAEATDQIKEGVAEVLGDKLMGNWQEFIDNDNRFIVKYPAEFTSGTSSQSLFKLSRVGTTSTAFEIKKFIAYGNLTNMINVRKIVQRPDHFLVIFDYENSTTTNLIFNSFESIDNNL